MLFKHTIASFVVFILFIQTFSGCSLKNIRPKKTALVAMETIIQPNGMPTKELARLLELTSIVPVQNPHQLIEATQHQYLRPKNLERWELEPLHFGEYQEEILTLLQKMGFIDEVHASGRNFHGALILGGVVGAMRQRIAFLVEEWKRGVHCAYIVCLTGDRARFQEKESASILFNKNNGILPLKADFKAPDILPENELEIMKFLFAHSELPEEFSKIPVIFVDAKKTAHSDPSNKRITTLDTMRAWLQEHKPMPADYLVVSCQPHIIYQDVIAHSVAPPSFRLESIGPKEVYGPLTIQNALDALARALYQNHHR